MSYPMLESPLGNLYWFDNHYIGSDSEEAKALFVPTEEVTYYETVRIRNGILLYFEDHLRRLKRSVQGIENFDVDTDAISNASYDFLKQTGNTEYNGNLRIVLTKSHLLIHICEANIPDPICFKNGINSITLSWERVDPNIKVFRGDYKKAVADTFALENKYGHPYEVLLTDKDGKLYEGSKSNLFVIRGNKVYSAPDEKILLGITRNRVISSLQEAGGELLTGMFTLRELAEDGQAAIFVSSTPFDILPVEYVDEYHFNSASNELLNRISRNYLKAADEYIALKKAELAD